MEVINLEREFVYQKDKKEIKLPDPNPEMSSGEVLKFYASSRPELTNAIIEGPKIVGDKANFIIKTKAGDIERGKNATIKNNWPK
jgi:PRTRC genetic system protein C